MRNENMPKMDLHVSENKIYLISTFNSFEFEFGFSKFSTKISPTYLDLEIRLIYIHRINIHKYMYIVLYLSPENMLDYVYIAF